jgi:hypothetical protein
MKVDKSEDHEKKDGKRHTFADSFSHLGGDYYRRMKYI